MWKALAVSLSLIVAALMIRMASFDHPAHMISHMVSELCGSEAPFLAENQEAMQRMMVGMDIDPSGDADLDFSAMMIPHHRGAIEMAQAELRHGHNEQLRRIAQEIIVEQQQEIAAMRLALGQELPAATAAPDQASDLVAAVPTSGRQAALPTAIMVH